MHSVLRVQQKRWHPQLDKPLKQAVTKTAVRRFLRKDERAELAVVADHHQLLDAAGARNQRERLSGLHSLIKENAGEGDVVEEALAGGGAGAADDLCGADDLVAEGFRFFGGAAGVVLKKAVET